MTTLSAEPGCIVRPALQSLQSRSKPFARTLEKPLWVLLTIALIGLAVTSRFGMIAWPFLNDSGLYAAMGRTVADGHVLYRDFYETKLPGAALLASAFWRAFGDHWAGYVICQTGMSFIAAGLLARSAARHFDRDNALPSFLFAVVFLNLSQSVYTGFQLETMQAFFEVIAAAMVLEALDGNMLAAFAAGLTAGVAAMAKPGGIGVALAGGVLLVCSRSRTCLPHAGVLSANTTHKPLRKIKQIQLIVALTTGLAIPIAATVFFTVQTGAWPYLSGVMRDIANYATGTPIGIDTFIKPGIALAFIGFPFVMLLPRRMGKIDAKTLFIIAWFVCDLLAVLLQRRLYPYHFLPLAAPAALLYGMLPGSDRWHRVAIGLLPISLLSLTWEGSNITLLQRGFSRDELSLYIASHTGPNDTVFADQVGRLLIEADRQPGSRLGTFFYLVNDDDAPQGYMSILLNDFAMRRPKYLILPRNFETAEPSLAGCDILHRSPQRRASFLSQWQRLREYVAGHYHRETCINNMQVYRRNPG